MMEFDLASFWLGALALGGTITVGWLVSTALRWFVEDIVETRIRERETTKATLKSFQSEFRS